MDAQSVVLIVIESILLAIFLACASNCIFILLKDRRSLLWFCFPMALLTLAISSFAVLDFISVSRATGTAVQSVKSILVFVANLIADAILIRRCYLVWENEIKIVALPSVLLLLTLAFDIASFATETHISFLAPYAMSFSTNVLVTALLAGRVWWVTSKSSAILGHGIQRQYISVISIVLESGLLYSLSVFGVLLCYPIAIYTNSPAAAGVFQCMIRISLLLSGIVPALSIIRASKGKKTSDVENTASIAFRRAGGQKALSENTDKTLMPISKNTTFLHSIGSSIASVLDIAPNKNLTSHSKGASTSDSLSTVQSIETVATISKSESRFCQELQTPISNAGS